MQNDFNEDKDLESFQGTYFEINKDILFLLSKNNGSNKNLVLFPVVFLEKVILKVVEILVF